MITNLLSESLAVAGVIHAVSQAAGTVVTAAIDLSKFGQLLVIVDCGTAGSSATVTASLTGSATVGGSYVAIGSSSATALAASANIALMAIRVDQLVAANPTVAFIKVSVAVGVATSVIGVIVLGADGNYEPMSQNNVADVVSTFII